MKFLKLARRLFSASAAGLLCQTLVFAAVQTPVTADSPFPARSSRDASPKAEPAPAALSHFWQNANIYFLMTDRFSNGDQKNDLSVGRKRDADKLRGFEGGDLRGLTNKIRSGYFNKLGVDAIWTTPLAQNVRSSVAENEWGRTYGYHGYWILDWTAVDPNLGTEKELAAMIEAAHAKGIRVLADVVINHAGAPTEIDPKWPSDWVRAGPTCDYKSYAGTVNCELSFTLQDILTESEKPVPLPPFLVEKWRNEGRLQQELAELDAFFMRTGLPRAPKYYLVKWLCDWVRDYGIDGFRADTAKHADPEVWRVLRREAEYALTQWRAKHPERMKPEQAFYMVGEIFNYGVLGFQQAAESGLAYEYGDREVNFFEFGFDALVNMGFATHAKKPYAELFSAYASEFSGRFRGKGMLNYISSHDDGNPFDPKRVRTFESATKLMLAPGAVQIYYGDELGRSLEISGTKGDATLRSMMDWRAENSKTGAKLLAHWQKLGTFRSAHPAVGAGAHTELQRSPLVFARTLPGLDPHPKDRVIVALELSPGWASIPVRGVFSDGERVRDGYSGRSARVKNGAVKLRVDAAVVLLELHP